MNTFQINNELKALKCFKGVFPKDLLPNKTINQRPLAFIINTDNSDKPGQHWVALFINERNEAEYFDSFGFEPICCEIYNFLRKNNIKAINYNKYQIQSIKSEKCGAFCILFIKMRCNHFSFCEFLNIFASNLILNDNLVKKIL